MKSFDLKEGWRCYICPWFFFQVALDFSESLTLISETEDREHRDKQQNKQLQGIGDQLAPKGNTVGFR